MPESSISATGTATPIGVEADSVASSPAPVRQSTKSSGAMPSVTASVGLAEAPSDASSEDDGVVCEGAGEVAGVSEDESTAEESSPPQPAASAATRARDAT